MALGKNISPGQGETYYRKDDYYLEREGGDEHRLEWRGKLADEMGLVGKANAEDWKNALNGHFPGGIEIRGGSFKDPDTGELLKRAGTDFIIEAPKTVSMLYAATDKQEIKDWIMKTQAEVEKLSFDYLESQIGARRGHDGKEWETTGKALYGRVLHITNRDGECFIHGHGAFLNVTRNSDGKYQAMTNDRMMQYQRPIKEKGDAYWAKQFAEKGIAFEQGKYGEVQIAGFSREQIELHSTRGQNIEKYIRERWGVGRDEATQNMKDEAWERTRKAKKVHELEGLEARWKAEAKVSRVDEVVRKIEAQFEKGIGQKYLSPEKRLEIARESLKFAVDNLTERESAVREGELIRTALQDGRGKITMEDLEKAIETALKSGELIRQKDELAGSRANLITSREGMEREKRILRIEKEGRGAVEPIMNPLQAENAMNAIQEREGLTLNAEQRAAARAILTTDNRYAGINGYAGTGKTTMLKPAVESAKDAGFHVIGLAPQHSAVKALKESGIDDARTLQSWLADKKAGQAIGKKTLLVIDEAGLARTKDLETAMRRVEKAGGRAVLVGDVKQYESVEAGGAFRMLQDNGMETTLVTKMQRQNKAAANVREAAQASVDDPIKALKLLEKNITEIRDPGERAQAMANDFLNSKNPEDTLVVTGTHEARRAVNDRIREARGLVGKGEKFTVFQAEDRTAAELKKLRMYKEGDDLKFSRDYKSLGVKNGDTAKVVAAGRGSLRIELENGTIKPFSPHRLKGSKGEDGEERMGWEKGRMEELEITKGDRIRITGNALKNEGITNGMSGEVLGIEKKNIDRSTWRRTSGAERIVLGEKEWEKKQNAKEELTLKVRFDGEKKSREVRMTRGGLMEADHGYARTGHSIQGMGVETTILDLSPKMLNRRSFYTNMTRAKGSVKGYTDDIKGLLKAVTKTSEKSLAHDVLSKNKNERMEGRGAGK